MRTPTGRVGAKRFVGPRSILFKSGRAKTPGTLPGNPMSGKCAAHPLRNTHMTPSDPARDLLLEQFHRAVDGGAASADVAAEFARFVRTHPDCCERTCVPGHLTGSAWVVSKDGLRTLLTHHRKLDRWLQPGGHADGDTDLARVALREAEEETGLTGLVVEPGIFDLDRHAIPARKADPEHWHYDVRFVVRATGSEEFVVSEESHALAWRDIAGIAADEQGDESVRRMARKWLHRRAAGAAFNSGAGQAPES